MPTPITDDQLFIYAKRAMGKVVVITGACVTESRSKVVIGDVNAAGGVAVANTIWKEGGEAVSIKCDVTRWDEQVALFELAIARFDAVDIVIPNAGINESEEVCLGNLKFVDGKPSKPELFTLKVNLIGVFYTAHLGMYYMKRNRSADAWKSLVMIGSMASWVGLFTAQQYSAAKHGVLGLMRSLDPFAESDDIRTACIHPWFTDTNIIDWKSRALTVGMPMTPAERVAGAIFRAATDPDRATSGCPWVLPDDGPVLLLKKEVLNEGVYEMLNKRVSRIVSFRTTVLFWLAVFHDLGRLLRPILVLGGVASVGLLLATTTLKFRS